MKPLTKIFGLGKRAQSSNAPASNVADQIAQALSAAGLDHSGAGGAIRATIDRALASAGLQAPRDAAEFIDAEPANEVLPDAGDVATGRVTSRGQFLHGTFGNAHGRRDYRLYLPLGYDPDGAPVPLILMLHGCTQTAEDFAIGTRMNALADRHGFLVAYPQQVGKANHAKCWNWFRPEDQRATAGEPSVLAGIVSQVALEYRVDTLRIFVAGLSAGAAMAVILGRTRPDLVRAIGVHSGLPYASAHDMPSAFATMQGRGATAGEAIQAAQRIPTILFHGDADRTVAHANADAIAAQSLQAGLNVTSESGRSTGGQSYTRQTASDDAGVRRFERWTVHGAGHAWSGGDPAGSYTDAAGPDASAAMVAFFLQQG
ncbi:extracellular catalytic domain type 1 short-chain-length polyhydroxyalkanoate depolymerase [Cognatilysobacter lacus]|uniref:PHB depolymerase family esterase n=1 Tax=Cognatilysobacter lacus TaxID=1643323 RepID=A0A5D8Z2B6_9GAMM|nr:PHB depolymerase family esterase [Lysobacter lacus]TZF88790.1 PHB depolymerase family esterase [Lysobacter lacus]